MLSILFALLVGYLLHFVNLDGLFHHLLNFSEVQYYLVWFILGLLNAVKNIFSK